MNRTTLSIAFLFLLILLLNMPSLFDSKSTEPLSEEDETWQANYQAKNLRSTLYDTEGIITHRVFAKKMEHYEALGFTIFEFPLYTIFTDRTERPWEVQANEGTLYEDNRIQLEDNVRIKSLNAAGFVQTIETSFIEINLNDKTATSDQPVIITGPDYVIQSNGFVANLLTRKFELSDHVQTVFQPQ